MADNKTAMMTRVMISGSRHWVDAAAIRRELLKLDTTRTIIVHGACPTGADAIADRLAVQMGFAVEPYPAEWKKYGRSAGPRRNQEMVDISDRLIAFPLPDSVGTVDAINRARQKGLPVLVIQ